MPEVLTVTEICNRLSIRPQVINAWVRKEGLKVASEKPRTINWEYLQDWLKQRETDHKSIHHKKREAATEDGPEDVDSRTARRIRNLTEQERRLFAWGRGDGRGYALARPTDKAQPLDNYMELLTHDNKLNPALGTKILSEIEKGQIFFLEPVQVLVLVAGQISALAREKQDPVLFELTDQLLGLIKQLDGWKEVHTNGTGGPHR